MKKGVPSARTATLAGLAATSISLPVVGLRPRALLLSRLDAHRQLNESADSDLVGVYGSADEDKRYVGPPSAAVRIVRPMELDAARAAVHAGYS